MPTTIKKKLIQQPQEKSIYVSFVYKTAGQKYVQARQMYMTESCMTLSHIKNKEAAHEI